MADDVDAAVDPVQPPGRHAPVDAGPVEPRRLQLRGRDAPPLPARDRGDPRVRAEWADFVSPSDTFSAHLASVAVPGARKAPGLQRWARMPNRRPQLQLVTETASPEEAAAVMAAVEQFLRDHAPPPAPVDEGPAGWMRAARLEAVEREPQHEPWL